jgi:hypothetical protein
MPRRSSNSKPPKQKGAADDEPPPKNPHAQALGRLGGMKGGKARAEKLSPKRRAEIAKRAAQARWKRKKPK